MKHAWSFLAAVACAASGVPAYAKDAQTLRLIFVDVEGGAATLVVTPHHHAILIDAGWPAALSGGGVAIEEPSAMTVSSSARRIIAAARAAHVSRIDYLLLTHYHTDHLGGARELIGAFPIRAFIDHGANREPAVAEPAVNRRGYQAAELYSGYLAAIAGRRHRVMRPGDTLTLDGLKLTAVDSDGAVLARPLPHAGGAGVDCDAAPAQTDIGTDENPRSLGTVLQWGKARILALGDTTREVETALACPRDLIGPVDLMIADNHGTANAGSPALLDTLRPSLYVFNNGATKGADEASLRFANAAHYIRGVWQMHFAMRSPEANTKPAHIANLDTDHDGYALKMSVGKDGTIAITNDRTQGIETYPAR